LVWLGKKRRRKVMALFESLENENRAVNSLVRIANSVGRVVEMFERIENLIMKEIDKKKKRD
jgi:hypothetical protein